VVQFDAPYQQPPRISSPEIKQAREAELSQREAVEATLAPWTERCMLAEERLKAKEAEVPPLQQRLDEAMQAAASHLSEKRSLAEQVEELTKRYHTAEAALVHGNKEVLLATHAMENAQSELERVQQSSNARVAGAIAVAKKNKAVVVDAALRALHQLRGHLTHTLTGLREQQQAVFDTAGSGLAFRQWGHRWGAVSATGDSVVVQFDAPYQQPPRISSPEIKPRPRATYDVPLGVSVRLYSEARVHLTQPGLPQPSFSQPSHTAPSKVPAVPSKSPPSRPRPESARATGQPLSHVASVSLSKGTAPRDAYDAHAAYEQLRSGKTLAPPHPPSDQQARLELMLMPKQAAATDAQARLLNGQPSTSAPAERPRPPQSLAERPSSFVGSPLCAIGSRPPTTSPLPHLPSSHPPSSRAPPSPHASRPPPSSPEDSPRDSPNASPQIRPQAGAQLMPTASLNGPHLSSAPNGESATSSASHAAIANCAQSSAAIAHGAPPSATSPPANGISPSPPAPPTVSPRPKSGRLQRGLVSPHPSPPAKPGSAGSPSPRVPERTEQFGLAGRTVGRPATAGASPACSPARK